MSPAQRLFNYLCGELSDLTGEAFIGTRRFDLWVALASWGFHPAFNADPVHLVAALELGDSPSLRRLRNSFNGEVWEKLMGRIGNFDPTRETPEEILQRWGETRDR